MPDTKDPMEPLKRLQARMEEKAQELGLHLANFAFLPNTAGGPDAVQAVFILEDDAIAAANKDEAEIAEDELVAEFQKEIEEMDRRAKAEAAEAKEQAAIAGLMKTAGITESDEPATDVAEPDDPEGEAEFDHFDGILDKYAVKDPFGPSSLEELKDANDDGRDKLAEEFKKNLGNGGVLDW